MLHFTWYLDFLIGKSRLQVLGLDEFVKVEVFASAEHLLALLLLELLLLGYLSLDPLGLLIYLVCVVEGLCHLHLHFQQFLHIGLVVGR